MGVPAPKQSDQHIMEHKCTELSTRSEQASEGLCHTVCHALPPVAHADQDTKSVLSREYSQGSPGKWQFASVTQHSRTTLT